MSKIQKLFKKCDDCIAKSIPAVVVVFAVAVIARPYFHPLMDTPAEKARRVAIVACAREKALVFCAEKVPSFFNVKASPQENSNQNLFDEMRSATAYIVGGVCLPVVHEIKYWECDDLIRNAPQPAP